MENEILKILQDTGEPMRPAEIAQALDMDPKDVTKMIEELKKTGKIMSPKRCYYAPTT